MPESTTAMVGALAEDGLSQSFWKPETYGHRCLFE
jgi:hypothetical protein